MRRTLPVIFAAILIALLVLGAAGHSFNRVSSSTPDGALHNFFELVKA
jgi:hypothetical protein